MNGVKRTAPKARAITVVCTDGFKPFTREYTLCTKKIKLNALT